MDDGRVRPVNLAVLMRETFIALNDVVIARLAERGHPEVRAAHGAVFQYLDDTGTTVSALAERAQMTKQAMAELVLHLENQGYVTRTPDPHDRRAKLVLPTERGREVVSIAQNLVPELEDRLGQLLGADRVQALRADLETILNAKIDSGDEDSTVTPVRPADERGRERRFAGHRAPRRVN